MRYALAALVLLSATQYASAQNYPLAGEGTLITNKLVCNSVQDIKDLMSMAGKGDAALPLVAAKLRQNECHQWFADTRVLFEKSSVVKDPRNDQDETILCARRLDGDDARCFWTFPGGIR